MTKKKTSDFSELIKQVNSKPRKPIKKVTPVSRPKDETQFSFWIESSLLKKLKMRAVEEDSSIKDIINKSITSYISNK